MIFINRNLCFDLTFLYIVFSPNSIHSAMWLGAGIDEKIAAALAPAEPSTPPVISKLFPKARISKSPFAVPSCCFTVALASTSIAFIPAMLAISAWSSGWHVLRPDLQSDIRCRVIPSVAASFASLPPTCFAALSISAFSASSSSAACCMAFSSWGIFLVPKKRVQITCFGYITLHLQPKRGTPCN